jgi:hypothetical protein
MLKLKLAQLANIFWRGRVGDLYAKRVLDHLLTLGLDGARQQAQPVLGKTT